MSTEWALRESICEVGRRLFERGLAHSTAGNISARLQDGFLITPTDACLGRLQPAELAWVDRSGQQRSGEKASKTLALHRCIYEGDPVAGCVVHTHSTHLVALSLLGVWRTDCILPPITPYLVMKVGPVPMLAYALPGSPKVGEVVSTIIREQRPRGVMLERLGPVVWHTTPQTACAVLEELEETARLWLMTGRNTPALSDAEVQELCATFGVRWTLPTPT